MLRHHIAIPARPGEMLREHVERVTKIRTAQAECLRLEARMRRELQFNRKVEINATLRDSRTALEKLLQA